MSLKDRLRYAPRRKFPALDWVQQELREKASVVSTYQGDGMADAIVKAGYKRCLEIGLATGSTAVYMLSTGAEVVSIDRAQASWYGNAGLKAIERAGLQAKHRLVEGDSVQVLAQMYAAGERFDFAFLDGWKTFDHMAAEIYFVARLVRLGGMIVFDDAQMPSVRKVVRLATGHYAMESVDILPAESRKERIAHAALALAKLKPAAALHALGGHVAALKKTRNIEDLAVSKDWNFFAPC